MLISFIFFLFLVSQTNACQQQNFASGIVCVCNADGCESIPQIGEISGNDMTVFYTSPAYPGINEKNATFDDQEDSSAVLITVNSEQKFQKIIGFGGAFTDGTGINYNKLSADLQEKLLDSYFSDDGIGYNLCRVPIGSCDFSPRRYTLNDHDGDVKLEKFSVQYEDLFYKVNKYTGYSTQNVHQSYICSNYFLKMLPSNNGWTKGPN